MNTNASIDENLNKILREHLEGKNFSFGDSQKKYKLENGNTNANTKEIIISDESNSFSLELADIWRIKIEGENENIKYLKALKNWEWERDKDNLDDFFEDEQIQWYFKNYKDEEIRIDREKLEKIGLNWNQLVLERIDAKENSGEYLCSKEKFVLFIISELINRYQIHEESHKLLTWFKISGKRNFVQYFEQIIFKEKFTKYKNILVFIFIPILTTYTISSLVISAFILGTPLICVKLVLSNYNSLSNCSLPFLALENWGHTNWFLLAFVIYFIALLILRVNTFCKKFSMKG